MYGRSAGKAPLSPARSRRAAQAGRPVAGAALAGPAPPGPAQALAPQPLASPAGPAQAGLALAVLAVALAVTACSGQAPAVSLPAKGGTGAPSQAALTGPGHTPAQAVTSAYQGYWRAYAAAMSASGAGRARAILAPYSTPGGVTALIGSLRRVWRAHEAAYGGAVTHVRDVRLTGHRASVHDCLDLSHFGVLDKSTGQVVPNSFGLPDLNYYVTLELSGGRWRVSNMTPVEVPCTP